MEEERLVDQSPLREKTSEESSDPLSVDDASHLPKDEAERDSSPNMGTSGKEPCESTPASLSVSGPQTTRTPRAQRKVTKAHPVSPKKTHLGGLHFRKRGTKESIDRSTCSTTVGSTHGETTTSGSSRRLARQGSDLSAMSACSEVSETHPAATPAGPSDPGTEPVQDITVTKTEAREKDEGNSHKETHASYVGENDSDDETQPQPTVDDEDGDNGELTEPTGDATAQCCNTFKIEAATDNEMQSSKQSRSEDSLPKQPSLTFRRPSSSLSTSDPMNDESHVYVKSNEDCDSDSDSSSSSNEISYQFDCDSSTSDRGSIQMMGSSRKLTESGRDLGEANRNKRCGEFSPAFSNSIVRSINAVRLICGKIVNHPYVQHFIITLIILNALQMGISTFDFIDQHPQRLAAFDKLDSAFLIIFTIESAFQLIYHGINLFRDSWLTFDFLIVICSWAFSSLQVFRTLRTLRLIGRVKSLKRLTEALVEAVPRLTGIMFLFILVMYIYAVMVTVLFGDLWEKGITTDDYFSRLDITLFTLFQMITLDWAIIVREVMVVYPNLAPLVFSTYLSFTSFILFSLIVGVVCDAVSAIEHDATLLEKIEQKEQAQERILRLQHQVDYLKKQQKSVLASVQTVLDEIGEREGLRPPRTLRVSNRSVPPHPPLVEDTA